MLKVGKTVPNFETVTESGEYISSENLKGQKYVLYFYPRDNTPGCTKEACSFRDNYNVFLDQNIKVLGISGGNEQSHQKFKEKYDLPFPLLMDSNLEIAKKFGAKKIGNTVERITYLINEKGEIEGIYGGKEGIEKVNTSIHAEQIISFWKLK